MLKLFFASLFLISCGSTKPEPVTVTHEFRENKEASVQCPLHLHAQSARMTFWMNGEPKALEMRCE